MHLKDGITLQNGKYRIIRFISSGGFGCTYEAEHVMLEKRVAVKEFFVKDFCNRDETTAHVTVGTLSKKGLVSKLKKKFLDEAKALCRLSHPGIVHVSDVFEENGTAYFVMDFIDGKSLSEIINIQGPLSEKQALRYIEQVCNALSYVHSNNRLHLDIKPANIMIDGNDNAILIDFGTSKQYDEESGENTSILLGKTPGYAPPEQMSNKVQQFTPATDIYALGATLYKMLTGITPPDASDRIAGEKLASLPDIISTTTRSAINHALELNKTARPKNIENFNKELHSYEDPDITIIGVNTKSVKIESGKVVDTPVKIAKSNLRPNKQETKSLLSENRHPAYKERNWFTNLSIIISCLILLFSTIVGFHLRTSTIDITDIGIWILTLISINYSCLIFEGVKCKWYLPLIIWIPITILFRNFAYGFITLIYFFPILVLLISKRIGNKDESKQDISMGYRLNTLSLWDKNKNIITNLVISVTIVISIFAIAGVISNLDYSQSGEYYFQKNEYFQTLLATLCCSCYGIYLICRNAICGVFVILASLIICFICEYFIFGFDDNLPILLLSILYGFMASTFFLKKNDKNVWLLLN